MSSKPETDVLDWIATLAPEISDTIRDRPARTIVPRPRRESRSERALELLRKLAGTHLADGQPHRELELGDEIAQGGMGQILAAEQLTMGREVAVKTLREELRGDIGATLELLREAWVTGALEHPNVMPVYDIALDDDGSPLIVLKRIEGLTWSELIADAETIKERFGVSDALEWNLGILLRVLDALRYAHSRRIIHRDVKPDNVMIGGFGEVYLVDWGVAVSLDEDPSGRLPHISSVLGVVAGTPCYLAPEMLGEAQDERTDVYLAGAVLFEVLCGRPPHRGKSVLEVLTQVATSEPVIDAEVSVEIAAICRRSLQRSPDDRYQTVEDMRAAIQRFINHRGSSKLSEQAAARLVDLERVAGGDEPLHELTKSEGAKTADRQREMIYQLLAECRFGFGAALSAWPDNRDAKSGLDVALATVARFELVHENPGAADLLVKQIKEPSALVDGELVADVRTAKAQGEVARRRLAALSDEVDHRLGNRTRILFTAILGTLWIAIPLIVHFLDGDLQLAAGKDAYPRLILLTTGLILFVGGMVGWARASIGRSRVNRLLVTTTLTALLCQVVLFFGCWKMGIDPISVQCMLPLVWAFGGTIVCVLELRAVAPLTLGFFAAFFLSVSFPEYRFLFMSGSFVIVFVNAMFVWSRIVSVDARERPSIR